MKVSIIMGSISDKEIALEVARILDEFGVDYDVSVYSAHRTPHEVISHLEKMEAAGVDIFIAMAGKAAHLAGVIAGHTTKPVIAIPIKSSFMGGLDSLLSTVQMPSGVPVATVAVNGGKNAGLLAVQILALQDDTLAEKMGEYKDKMVADVIKMDEEIHELVKGEGQ